MQHLDVGRGRGFPDFFFELRPFIHYEKASRFNSMSGILNKVSNAEESPRHSNIEFLFPHILYSCFEHVHIIKREDAFYISKKGGLLSGGLYKCEAEVRSDNCEGHTGKASAAAAVASRTRTRNIPGCTP